MRSAADKKIAELTRRLHNEQTAHTITRNQLQQELTRVWRLVPSHYINLMGVYPPLRRLLHVLAEAADLQDPSRGAPVEDTMRTEFIPTGENASTSTTERGVLTHARHRSHVTQIIRDLEDRAHRYAQWIDADQYEYTPPDDECQSCGARLPQPSNGRPRKYCLRCAPRKTSGKL